MTRIHLIGICGTAMATLAALLKNRGIDVRGSDQNVYPPMSDFLQQQGITTLQGYSAAHITADSAEAGEPVVSNGLSLCKLHHAAFDRHFLAVRPDYTIEVRRSILEDEDGPMLLHGLKGMHDRPIYLPREVSLQPDRDRLDERYAEFRRTVA